MFIVNIVASSMIGTGTPRIQQAKAQRLNTKLPGVSKRYANLFKKKIKHHQLIDKLRDVHINSRSKEEAELKICKIDDKAGQYMAHTETNCQKLKSGRISCS